MMFWPKTVRLHGLKLKRKVFADRERFMAYLNDACVAEIYKTTTGWHVVTGLRKTSDRGPRELYFSSCDAETLEQAASVAAEWFKP